MLNLTYRLRPFWLLVSLLPLALLSGCASIAKGVAEAILEQEAEDARQCHIRGPAFTGVSQSLAAQPEAGPRKSTKVLVVHGISKHLPGYSTLFRNKLTERLGLTLESRDYKEILVQHEAFTRPDGGPERLGVLRISRHLNKARDKELLFYELTWSEISEPAKAALDFDNSEEYAHRRAGVNRSLKTFVNSTVPDLLVYQGESQKKINAAVSQAVCWTFHGDWANLPDGGLHLCSGETGEMADTIREDDYFFVTHSLGSKITVDTITYTTKLNNDLGNLNNLTSNIFDALKSQRLQVYMLSNQLPLLQVGQPRPEITGELDRYCRIGSAEYDERVFKELKLIAFSDPNDVLSYPLPPNYRHDHLDSRLCADIVNVSINVAPVNDAFGFEFANPLAAHGNYWEDDRVIGLITDGLNQDHQAEIVRERCDWTETVY